MNTQEKEMIVQVPIPEQVKAALEERASVNGRATGREAAQIIKNALRKAIEQAAK